MATFTCDRYPNLLVIGAGRFLNGRLTVSGAAAERVRVAARRLGITEVGEQSTPVEQSDDESEGQEPADESEGDGATVPGQNANKQELIDYILAEEIVDDESELEGHTKANLRELIETATAE